MSPQSTGPLYPTTTTTTAGSGSDGEWSNPSNIFSDNGSSAASSFLNVAIETQELNGAGFGFNIPSNAVIDGIIMEIEVPSSNRWQESQGTVKLKKAGSLVGDNKAGDGTTASNVWTYGGAEDLWGTTWTPAEINAANFGFGFVATYSSSPNDFSIGVDYVRLTVFWHYDVSVDPAEVPKRHLYKVYNNSGQYLGNLPKPLNPFGYALDMNSIGSSITIELGITPDTSSEASGYLMTEDEDYITDESGNRIRVDGTAPVIVTGDFADNALVKNGNRVVVWEYSYYHPNGKQMFSGQINRIQAPFGGDDEDKISILVMSDGLDLDHFIARGAPFSYTADVTQNTQNTYAAVTEDSKGVGWTRYGQTWVCGVGVTKLGAITIMVNGSANVTISVYDGLNGSLIGSVSQSVNTGGVPTAVQFGFANLIDVVPGATYFFTVSVAAGQSINLYCVDGNPYANGAMYSASYAGGSSGGSYGIYSTGAYDLYFIASSGLATTTATYTSKDPSTGMLEPIIDDYNLRGGRITYDDDTIEATGLSLTATFKVNTILEAIKSVKDMSPSGFYYYVDLGTNVLYFKDASEEADFILVKGRHLSSIDLVMSIENVKNKQLFSGGDVGGGVNLYSEYSDTTSQGLYGVRLDRKSDNRVTIQGTADAIGDSFIEEMSDEQYQTVVSVMDRTMDITLLKPGMIVGLRGFGMFIDTLLLQIARVEYTPEKANLTLGMLPVRTSMEFEKITRGLIAEQTVANPTAPS